jgi:acetyl-CoA carboxylase biotin carboxyl carrier protein
LLIHPLQAILAALITGDLGKDLGMSDKNSDLKKIEQLLDIMKKNDLVEIELKSGDDKIVLKRAGSQQPQVTAVPVIAPVVPTPAGTAAPSAAAIPEAAKPSDLVEIKAPMVGTFYATPNPDAEPYVEVGSKVTGSTVVCIIEAMKVMNEIKAEVEGTIAEVCVQSGQAVEYGTVLFKVKPD